MVAVVAWRGGVKPPPLAQAHPSFRAHRLSRQLRTSQDKPTHSTTTAKTPPPAATTP
jgi:hypothetical protein